ncbi:ribbon-helix-helix protein, CopG family [Vulgatibacter sp.]|uniref:ribbon-helix-helix protein, CopG family n=1 Tax=Vulgatibacter sp. TaxID=1971226 RepID=UPI003564F849
MSSQFEIDYDAEAVWLDEKWFTRDELAGRIKSMIEGGDYRLARPSAALERLESAMAQARVVAARVAPELAEAVEQAADDAGRPVSALIREALAYYLSAQAAEARPAGEDFPVVEEHVALDDPEMEKSLLAR